MNARPLIIRYCTWERKSINAININEDKHGEKHIQRWKWQDCAIDDVAISYDIIFVVSASETNLYWQDRHRQL